MTSPATKNACPSANRYQGVRDCGIHRRTAITIAIDDEMAMTLKKGPSRSPGTNRYMAVTTAPPQEYASQARLFTITYRVFGGWTLGPVVPGQEPASEADPEAAGTAGEADTGSAKAAGIIGPSRGPVIGAPMPSSSLVALARSPVRSRSRIPGMKRKTRVTMPPSTPAPMRVSRTPKTAATGPVRAKEIGTRPIEMNQSKLDTRPRSLSGTRRPLVVAHTIVPAPSSALKMKLATIACHGNLAMP